MTIEELRQEYNAAVANGLIIKARRIGRVMDAMAATAARTPAAAD